MNPSLNQPSESEFENPQPKGKRSWIPLIATILLGIGVAYIVMTGLAKRVSAERILKESAQESALVNVHLVQPSIGSALDEIALPGNVQAINEAPIYARTNGYLKAWYFDIGAHVQQGQLLAEIEAPEVDKQLQQARAELATTEASLELAKSTAERWKSLLRTNSVSQQETDEKIANANVWKTNYDAAASNVKRLEDLKSFQRIHAPFSGVITARNTDIGALISATATSPDQELFHLSAIHRLRVFINIPQMYASSAQKGSRASITLQESPSKKYTGRLVRTSNAIDPVARTLRTEFEVDNRNGELLPGSYVTVHLKLGEKTKALTIPATALLFRGEGLRVAVVKNDHTTQLVPITIGRDFGSSVEVLSGLKLEDQVIADPPDSLTDGSKVNPITRAEQGE